MARGNGSEQLIHSADGVSLGGKSWRIQTVSRAVADSVEVTFVPRSKMNFVASRAALRRSSLPMASASGFSATSLDKFSRAGGKVTASSNLVGPSMGMSVSTDIGQ